MAEHDDSKEKYGTPTPYKGNLGNNGDDLGRTDVEADNQFFALSAHDLPLRSEGVEVEGITLAE